MAADTVPSDAALESNQDSGTDLLLRIRLDALQHNLEQVQRYRDAVRSNAQGLAALESLMSENEVMARAIETAGEFIGNLDNAAKFDKVLRERLDSRHLSEKLEAESDNNLQNQLLAALGNIATARELVGKMTKRLSSLTEQAESKPLTRIFNSNIKKQLRRAKTLAGKLPARTGLGTQWSASDVHWTEFSRLVADIEQRVFPEYVEVLGGLALRGTGVDNDICLMIDKLLRAWTEVGGQELSYSICIPAVQECLTIGRVIRVGFPEWTIWSVPLCAHEFGKIVVADNNEIGDKLKEWTGSDVVLRRHCETYLADAFACCSMGPAYACAAILLKFDPAANESEDSDRAPDHYRVEVILSVLRELQAVQYPALPLDEFLDRLEQAWNSARGALQTRPATSQPEREQVDNAALRAEIVDFALYLLRDEGLLYSAAGWPRVQRLAKELFPRTATGETPAEATTLLEVLNAAWYERVENPNPRRADQIASLVSTTIWPDLQDASTNLSGSPGSPIDPSSPLSTTSFGNNTFPSRGMQSR
jgi:hypothetical protein